MVNLQQRGASRSAVVTGCSRGIGRAIAKRLASEGYTVVANDIPRQKEALEGLKSEILAEGGRCELVFADVSKPDDVNTLAREALRRCGAARAGYSSGSEWRAQED